jgi:tetratricopeptide (TPR) repeat protein
MVRIKEVLIGAALVLFPAAANAEEVAPSAEGIAAARELIAAQDQGGQLKQVGDVVSRMIQDQLSSTDPASAKSAGTFLRNTLSPDSPSMKQFMEEINAVQVKTYSADLTLDEMKQVTAFLQSEPYKKFTASSIKVLGGSSAIIAQFQRNIQFAAYEEMTKEQPKNATPWNGLCWITITTGGDLNKALEACNTALKLNPRFANAFDSRGLVYLKLGDYQRALADYDAALKLCPRMAGAAYGRGIAKVKLGDFAAGSEDIIMAKTANANLVAQFAAYGVK